MKLTKRTMLASVAFSTLAMATSAIAEDVVLKVWGVDGRDRAGIADSWSKEFTEMDNGITVEYRFVPFDELVNETLRAFATNQAPDLVSLDNPDMALFTSRGAFLDITDMVAESDVINPDNYFEGPLNSVTWDGRLYGIPKYTDTIGVFYNKDLFEKAGITEPPTTWAEFADYAKKLADPDNNVYGATWSARGNEEGTFQFLPIIQMAGGSYSNVNVPGAVEVLNIWKDLIDGGYASQDVLTMGQWDSTGTFNSGNAAMAVSGPWEINRMVDDAKFDWGVALLPTIEEGGARSSALGGFDWGIMSTTENPEAAFELLEYFASQDAVMFQDFGNIPARKDIELPPSGNANKDAALALFIEQLQYAQPRGPHPEWQKISKPIYDALQAALTGQTTPEAALEQAQKSIEGVLN